MTKIANMMYSALVDRWTSATPTQEVREIARSQPMPKARSSPPVPNDAAQLNPPLHAMAVKQEMAIPTSTSPSTTPPSTNAALPWTRMGSSGPLQVKHVPAFCAMPPMSVRRSVVHQMNGVCAHAACLAPRSPSVSSPLAMANGNGTFWLVWNTNAPTAKASHHSRRQWDHPAQLAKPIAGHVPGPRGLRCKTTRRLLLPTQVLH